jgi:hypothetical protein
MFLVAKISSQDPRGAKDEIVRRFKRLNETHPEWVRKLASDPGSRMKFSKAVLEKFDPSHYTLEHLKAWREDLAIALKQHYALHPELRSSGVEVKKGQTLQEISFDLYGRRRRWSELYLMNYEKIPNWDDVPTGLRLQVYIRRDSTVLKPVAGDQDRQQ